MIKFFLIYFLGREYVLNKKNKIIHHCTCEWVDNLTKGKKKDYQYITFRTAKKMVEQRTGYVCTKCKWLD
jgi:hypothetical protein